MNSKQFEAYKTRYRSAIRQVLNEVERGRLDEAGFPAYSHQNPLINWLFWQRLRIVMNYLEQQGPCERILDFGCGSGVMLPFLSQISKHVTAYDIDLLPLERVGRYIPLADNIEVNDANRTNNGSLQSSAFDIVVALDVLEHIKDLTTTLDFFRSLLKPGGQLIVSGPTENFLYQIGRRLAGPEYSGDYHERGIAEIQHMLANYAQVRHISTLYWPVPLFKVFAAIVE